MATAIAFINDCIRYTYIVLEKKTKKTKDTNKIHLQKATFSPLSRGKNHDEKIYSQ